MPKPVLNFLPAMLSRFFSFLLLASLCFFSQGKKADQNSYLKRTGAKYIEEVAKRDGSIELNSGMVIEILKSATVETAKSPTASDQCEVTYSGTLKDGSMNLHALAVTCFVT